ncbi:hypothetical protein ACJA25_00460 [Mycoplasmopsis hyopharyngis]
MSKCIKCKTTKDLEVWNVYVCCKNCLPEVKQWAQEYYLKELCEMK